MQNNDGISDNLMWVKAQLDGFYADFLSKMEQAINQAYAEMHAHLFNTLSMNPEVLENLSKQASRTEIADKLAYALKYLMPRFSDRILTESIDLLFNNALSEAMDKHKDLCTAMMETESNVFLSMYDPENRFQLHLN